jgi:predicted metal-dependent phosphoesterase TrpH
LGRADLHLHSARSDGMMVVSDLLAHVERETALDVVAVADHDQVAGALEAVEWCAGRPGGRVRAVVGTEISASWGRHLVALFFREPYPTRPFPRFRPLRETVARVADAGGVVVVPHALSPLVPSLGERALRRLLALPGMREAILGVEVCSGVVGGRRSEPRLRRLNTAEWGLATLGSSDAHHLAQVASAYTEFPGSTPADLLAAMRGRRTEAHWGQAPRVRLASHARQGWQSLVVKPARELRAALASDARPAGLDRGAQHGELDVLGGERGGE